MRASKTQRERRSWTGRGVKSKWFSRLSILAPSGLDEVVGLRWVCPEFCFGVAVRSEQVPIGGKRADVVQVHAPQGKRWEGRGRERERYESLVEGQEASWD